MSARPYTRDEVARIRLEPTVGIDPRWLATLDAREAEHAVAVAQKNDEIARLEATVRQLLRQLREPSLR